MIGGTEPGRDPRPTTRQPGRAMFAFSLWRALVAFRWLALIYAALLYARDFSSGDYAHPAAGWVLVAIMTGWTAVCSAVILARRGAGQVLLTLDLVVTFACIVSLAWIDSNKHLASGALLPSIWVIGPAFGWGIARGWAFGLLAGLVVGTAQLLAAGKFTNIVMQNVVLIVLGGAVMGYVADLGRRSEARLARAVAVEGAVRERERLARGIHDGVLQVLALVARRGAELGGGAAELGRLAGEQEAALRNLVASGPSVAVASSAAGAPDAADTTDLVDLRPVLSGLGGSGVTVSAPATPVPVSSRLAAELVAAVRAALDNVERHAPGAHAWVLVEDDGEAVVVGVRDNGPGFAPGRLAEAEVDGRLGVAQSIRGRLRDLGGSATVTGSPGGGCEVELRIPKVRVG